MFFQEDPREVLTSKQLQVRIKKKLIWKLNSNTGGEITTTNDCCPEYSFKVTHFTLQCTLDFKGSPDCYEFCEIMNMMNEMADLFGGIGGVGRVKREEHSRMRRQDNLFHIQFLLGIPDICSYASSPNNLWCNEIFEIQN